MSRSANPWQRQNVNFTDVVVVSLEFVFALSWQARWSSHTWLAIVLRRVSSTAEQLNGPYAVFYEDFQSYREGQACMCVFDSCEHSTEPSLHILRNDYCVVCSIMTHVVLRTCHGSTGLPRRISETSFWSCSWTLLPKKRSNWRVLFSHKNDNVLLHLRTHSNHQEMWNIFSQTPILYNKHGVNLSSSSKISHFRHEHLWKLGRLYFCQSSLFCSFGRFDGAWKKEKIIALVVCLLSREVYKGRYEFIFHNTTSWCHSAGRCTQLILGSHLHNPNIYLIKQNPALNPLFRLVKPRYRYTVVVRRKLIMAVLPLTHIWGFWSLLDSLKYKLQSNSFFTKCQLPSGPKSTRILSRHKILN